MSRGLGALAGLLALTGACAPEASPPRQARAEATGLSAAVRSRMATEDELRVVIRYRTAPTGPGVRISDAARSRYADSGARVAAQLRERGIRVTRAFALSPWVAATVRTDALLSLRDDPRVARVELDLPGQGQLLQSGPLIGLPDVTAAGFTGSGVQVATLDTGVDGTHADLGELGAEACFCGNDCCPGGGSSDSGSGSAVDGHGHGTHVAGAIIAQGTIGPRGVAPDATLLAVKVLDDSNNLSALSDVTAGLEWILSNHPQTDIVNLSLGTLGAYAGDCDAAEGIAPLAAAADALRDNGTMLVAASGNGAASDGMAAPACIASVLSVGAVWDADVGPESIVCQEAATFPDLIACFSNASSTTDLVAPGARITSLWPGDGARARSGTSHAAPVASGCLAALMEAHPDATLDALESALQASPVRLTDSKNGIDYPRLDCADALSRLAPPPPDAGSGDDLDGGVAGSDTGTEEAEPIGTGDEDAGSDPPAAADGGPSPGDPAPIPDAAGMGAPPPDARADGAVPVPPPVPAVDAATSDDGDGGHVAVSGAADTDCSCSLSGRARSGPWHAVGLVLLAVGLRLRRRH